MHYSIQLRNISTSISFSKVIFTCLYWILLFSPSPLRLSKRILEDLGFDRVGDEEAAQILSRMLTEKNTVSLSELKAIISGKPVLVCGNAPNLRKELLEIDLSAFVITAICGAITLIKNTCRVAEVISTDFIVNS